MNRIIQEMQTYYKKRASIYDTSMHYDSPETLKKLTPVIERIKELLINKTVLEIACGACFWTQQVYTAAKYIVATDYNESSLAEARRKNLDWNKISLQRADAYYLPSFDLTFDGCLAVDWFSHVPREDFHLFLENLQTKLKKGSKVVLCDQLPGPNSISSLRDEEGNHLQERKLPDGSPYYVIKHFLSDQEYHSIFANYTTTLTIDHFEECRRLVVSYDVGV